MSTTPIRLLLVEDDDDHAMLVMRILARCCPHAAVDRFASADAALRRLVGPDADALPDAVLLDLKLPGMSGHELLEALRRTPATEQLPIIVLTTSDADADRNRAATGRADGYLVKPIEPAPLVAAIDRIRLVCRR